MELGYSIHGIEIIESSISPKPEDFVGTSFGFSINAETRVKPSNDLIIIFVDIHISEDHKRDILLGRLRTGIGFSINNFPKIIIENDGKYTVPMEIEINLRMIAISTSRGLLFSHVKGTYLGGAILPLVPALINPASNNENPQKIKPTKKAKISS